MLFVTTSELSLGDLAALGNNLRPCRRPKQRRIDALENRRIIAAVNRSLAAHQQRVDRLHPLAVTAAR